MYLKSVLFRSALVVGLAAAGFAALPAIQVHVSEASPAQQSPFFCDAGALAPAERKRHFKELGPALAAKRLSVRALDDGYEFEFPSDKLTYQQLADWIGAERACCPFFDLGLRVSPEHGPLILRLTGRPGTKEFIEADGGDWLAAIGRQI